MQKKETITLTGATATELEKNIANHMRYNFKPIDNVLNADGMYQIKMER